MKNSLALLLAALALALPLRAQQTEDEIDADGQPQTFVVFSVSNERGAKIGKTLLQGMPELLTEGKAVLRVLHYTRTLDPEAEAQCDEELIAYIDLALQKGAKGIAIDGQLCHGPAVKAKLKALRAQGIKAGMADLPE